MNYVRDVIKEAIKAEFTYNGDGCMEGEICVNGKTIYFIGAKHYKVTGSVLL